MMDKNVIQRIKSQKPLIYYPLTAKLTGSIISAILLEQILYWWDRSQSQPFYKYRKPCLASRPGDSWVEELGFTITEFDNARGTIATKIKKGDKKTDYLLTTILPSINKDETDQDFICRCREILKRLVLYWTDSTGKTWYQVNVPLVSESFYLIHSGESGFPIRLKNADSRFSFFAESTSENNSTIPSTSEGGQNTITPAIKGNVTKLLNHYKKLAGIKKLTHPLWEEAIATQTEKIQSMAAAKTDRERAIHEAELLILEELKNRNPDNIAPAKVPTADEIFMAVVDLWGNPAASGRAWNIRHLLTGTSKTGQWAKCKLQTPATREELYAYKKWRNSQGRGKMNMPQKPDQIQKSFEEFRAHPQYSHFMQNYKLEDATPEERGKIDDGVKRASGSEQPNLHEKTMPRFLRMNWYEQNNIEYDPDTGIRIGADPEGYVV